MSVQCPVCRDPIPFVRVFFTPAWGKWRCARCESLLGVNVTRRFGGIAAAVGSMFLLTRFTNVPPAWDLPFVLGTFGSVFALYFLFVERPRVLEHCGFRCRGCGYDLQGQTVPRCPECGLTLDEKQRARMTHAKDDTSAAAPKHRRMGWALIIVLGLAVLATALAVGITRFSKDARPPIGVEVQRLVSGLKAYAHQHERQWPRHVALAVASHQLACENVLSVESLTMPDRVPIAGQTLDRFCAASLPRKQEAAKTAAEALPAATIAHRLGDFVFTYHGIDLATADASLWLVIWSPDPSVNSRVTPDDEIAVGLAGGGVEWINMREGVDALVKQNELRFRLGLPPLTNPFGVRHSKPAIAPGSPTAP